MPQNLCYVEVHFPCHLRDVSACLRVRCSKKLVVSSRKCVNQPWWLQVEECSEQVESVNVAFFFFSPVTFRQILLNVSRFLYETLKVCSVYRLFLSSSLVFISPRLVSVRFFFCFVFLFVFLGSYLSSFFFFSGRIYVMTLYIWRCVCSLTVPLIVFAMNLHKPYEKKYNGMWCAWTDRVVVF